MSPIPSVATAFALSPATPSVALDPDSAGQSASAMSQHLLGTGGIVFAVVAIVSVAGYFYHGRGTANSSRTSNTWASLSSFLSSMRQRGSVATATAAATDWPVDLEVGPEHVSMVYARFFHPTFWNLVECHPATASAPAIYVEDEGEIPVSEPKPSGMNSFLDMDDDDDDDGDDNPKRARGNENPDQGVTPRVEQVPPYDTSSPTNVNFSSEIIGTTVRPGAFLSVAEEHEDDSSETSSSDSDPDFTCSLYGGILTTPPRSSDHSFATSSSDSELDFTCSPYDGIMTTPPGSSDYLSEAWSDSELDFTCSPYDGIMATPPRFSPSTRRYGMPDMADLAQTLKDTIPEEGYDLVPTISRRTGLCDVSEFGETDSAMSRRFLDRIEPMDDKPMISSCDIGVHDSRDGLRKSSSDGDIFAAPHEGLHLMRRLLEELRDPNMDCTPRALSEDSDYEDSDFEYSEDDEDKGSVPPAWILDGMERISLESTSSTPRTNSDVSDKGPIYPLTPPPRSTTFDVHKARMPSPITAWFNEEVQVMSPTSSDSPPSLPFKGYGRTHRNSRFLLYGPRSPLVVSPRL